MERNLGLFLAKRASITPGLEGLVEVESGRRFTYRELDARANRLANALLARGVDKGDRVACLMMNGVEYVETFFALAKIGAVLVPLNWRLVADELAYILGNAGARLLLYGADFAELVETLHRRAARETELTDWIELGGGEHRHPFADDYESLVAAAPSEPPPIRAGEHDLLFIMYTSGTTGLPKGSMHTHGTFTWAVMSMGTTAELRFHDRYAVVLPLYHVGALLPVISNVYRGVTNVVLRQFEPGRMWEVIERERVSVSLLVPAMLNFMLQVPEGERRDYSSMRWILSGATPVPVTLIERYRVIGIEIHQAYGLTESGGPACIISPDDAMKRIGSTGKTFFHNDVRIVDETGRDVPPGVPGELIVQAPHVMVGYWRNPEATAEAIRNGWLYTGDVAIADAEGFVTIHDRVKDMVISGGENVYPAEIENVILRHPAVAEVAVIGQASERWGESPFAVVVVKHGERLSEADVLGHCDGKLARYKRPKGVAFVDEIPRNPTGKALKRILRERFPGPAPE